jgi:predicted RNA methylase
VLDLFAGSGNLMFHAKRILSASLAIGFERDDLVYRLTRMNFELIGLDAALYHGDCEALLDERHVPPDHLCIALIAPPWGNAFDFIRGLDLRPGPPPVTSSWSSCEGGCAAAGALCAEHTSSLRNRPL